MTHPLAILILAAGKGSRMKSDKPKVLHEIGSLPLINHVINTAQSLNPEKIVCVIGPDMPDVAKAAMPHECVVQTEQLGTGHAVQTGMGALSGFKGTIVVMYGDTPLIRTETFEALIARHTAKDTPGCTVLSMTPPDPSGYGRVVVDQHGNLLNIIEDKDCTPEQRTVKTCNSGILCFDGKGLAHWLEQLNDDNAQNEYYITDIPKIAAGSGRLSAAVNAEYEECIGVNTRAQLAQLESQFQNRKREDAMANGATLINPDSVTFAHDTKLGRDVIIEPNVFFGAGVSIGNHAHIKAFCHFEDATLADGVIIGPFARLRPGTNLSQNVKVGNFVEIKKANIGEGSKVNHLSYIGDAKIGEGANIGAGTITCNYDGFDKHITDIGDGVFVGSNSTLIAPITLNKGAYIGAGSIITRNIEADALAVSRPKTLQKSQWAANFRKKKM